MASSAYDTAILLLRVVLGLDHGRARLQQVLRWRQIPGTAGWFDSIGKKPGSVPCLGTRPAPRSPPVSAWLLGLLTRCPRPDSWRRCWWRPDRAPANGFFIVKEGWEYNLVLAAAAVAIAGTGAGRYSLDHLLFSNCSFYHLLHGWCGLAIAAGARSRRRGIGQLVIFFRPPAKTSQFVRRADDR